MNMFSRNGFVIQMQGLRLEAIPAASLRWPADAWQRIVDAG